ncbi:DUF805 domain-containing protein [uncultured Thiodictyon sp.]|uniref:DUF805 domain-containing protein n=1 Tax=uncultured Thiodictyon sp. TaxID=1846217 RepID=UPI0025F1716C|nr:DUF805 domain-containing protein [uncultured Thiodictyon sp.]
MDKSNPYASPLSDVTRPAPMGVDSTSPFDPNGRFSRLSWLAWSLVLGVVGSVVVGVLVFVLSLLGLVAMPQPGADPSAAVPIVGVIVMLIPYLIMVVLGVILTVRRFHDIDASGWWCLLFIVPLANLVAFLVLLFKRGDDAANRFGPPRPTAGWEQVVAIIYIVLIVLGLVGGIIAAIAIPSVISYQTSGMH